MSWRIYNGIRFSPGKTHVGKTAAEVLSGGHGVCQDFSHLAVACRPSLGLAARCVSGYVDTADFRGKAHRIAGDACHAWFSVLDPDQ